MDLERNNSNTRCRGRAVTACLECRKMKKKCDRQWPCNHCTTRKMAHMCQFSQATRKHQRAPKEAPSTTSSTSVSESQDDVANSTTSASAVHMLGYMYAKNDTLFGSIMETQYVDSPKSLPQPVIQASRAISPRPYTDMLLKNFFDNINYHYGVLHQPSFMAVYVDWWSQRRDAQSLRNPLAMALTCLILRICANSTQFLSPHASSQLELDLGDSIENLSKTYHDAAQIISGFLSPGTGGLLNAQQLFLAATWHKGQADFVRSWHELGAAVRQSQEIGIHTDVFSNEMNEFDLEMRRRLWCALYTWDRYMTASFNRPPIIQSEVSTPLPNPGLDQSGADPNVPSHIVAKIFECQLARQLGEGDRVDRSNLQSKIACVEKWMLSLPPVFDIVDPDKRWDGNYPYIPFQRLQLHCVGYMTQVILVRSILTSSEIFSEASYIGTGIDSETSMLIHQAVNLSLKAMSVSKDTFDLCFPQQAKYYMVAFCPFDNAALLCSLLIHDINGTMVPQRSEVIYAIGQALHISHRLRGFTKMGGITWTILSALKNRINLNPSEKAVLEELESAGKADIATHCLKDSLEQTDALFHSINGSSSHVHSGSDEGLRFVENTLAADDSEFLDMNLGILDGVWNWERVGF
ncbi:fungal-specific transcription factor domain-containing protein [Trichoderma evansii]